MHWHWGSTSEAGSEHTVNNLMLEIFLTSPLDPGGDFLITTQPLEPFDLIQVEGRRYPMEVHLVHKVISLSSQGLMMHTYAIGCIG